MHIYFYHVIKCDIYYLRDTHLFQILSVTVFPMSYLKIISHITQILNGFCGAVPFSGVMYITGITKGPQGAGL